MSKTLVMILFLFPTISHASALGRRNRRGTTPHNHHHYRRVQNRRLYNIFTHKYNKDPTTTFEEEEEEDVGSDGGTSNLHSDTTQDSTAEADFMILNTDATTRLDFSSDPAQTGKVSILKALGNMSMRYRSDGTLTWNIKVANRAAAGEYRVSVAASYFGTEPSVTLKAYVDGKKTEGVEGPIEYVQGHFSDEYTPQKFFRMSEKKIREEFLWNYPRTVLPGTITLSAGKQTVVLEATGMIQSQMIDFRSLELTPVSAETAIAADYKNALAARAPTETLVSSVYGVMVHWTDLSANLDASEKPYRNAVAKFDVPRFVRLCETMGAGHVLFTLNHQHPHCPAPIAAWEEMHPNWTTERDLIGEIADALAEAGIDFMLYLASHLVGKPDNIGLDDKGERVWLKAHHVFSDSDLRDGEYFDIVESNKKALTAIGERYGSRVKGFWLDGFDLIPETYPAGDFKGLFDAAKAGYGDRLVSYNRWLFPTVSPWQDYWAGEIDSVEEMYEDGQTIGFDAGKGLLYHGLIAMEDDWVLTKENLDCGQNYYKPRFNKKDVIGFVKDVQKRKGVTTINVAIQQNGDIMPKTLEIMKALRAAIRNGPPPDDDGGADGDDDDNDDESPAPTPAPDCEDDEKKKFPHGKKKKKKNCAWLAKQKKKANKAKTVKNLCKKKAKFCMETCDLCGDGGGGGGDDDSSQIYKGKGYCNDGNEETLEKINGASLCGKACKSRLGWDYAEYTDKACYCTKACPCMDGAGDNSITAIVPKGFNLPNKC